MHFSPAKLHNNHLSTCYVITSATNQAFRIHYNRNTRQLLKMHGDCLNLAIMRHLHVRNIVMESLEYTRFEFI